MDFDNCEKKEHVFLIIFLRFGRSNAFGNVIVGEASGVLVVDPDYHSWLPFISANGRSTFSKQFH